MSVASPSSMSEVRTLVGEARNTRRPLWFTGSGTTQVPDDHTIVSTMGLSGVVDYKPDDLTIVVRPGTTLTELDATLKEHGHTAVLPETSPERTVGGVVASGASGYRRLRYGPTRDRVIGIRFVTGYGEVVHSGGQLVKNVTGYDLPRLMTGSYGALGFIAEISLKLWPIDSLPRTFREETPGAVRKQLYRPTAALETEDGCFVYASAVDVSDASVSVGFAWPDPLDQQVTVSFNVPARFVEEGIDRAHDAGATRLVAQHGVGAIDVGWDTVAESQILALRTWAESGGGSLVLRRRGSLAGSVSRWGAVPSSVSIQHRLKSLFDPDRICNPGVLPGGV